MRTYSLHIIRFLLVVACYLFCSSCIMLPATAQSTAKVIVVDQAGNGDFTSIQDAINSLPDKATAPRIIFIRNGLYQEKIFIEKDFITLVGEDKNKTLLQISLAREIWRCENPDDWGVATINLKGSDITLENLTISNTFGLDHANDTEGVHIDCRADSLNPFKTVKRDSHQMALRSFETTRLIVRNCILRAYGGDTVSPWNTDSGMFYFKDCLMEGGVDFYCPRGWAWAENCEFVAHSKTAAIWHDGSVHKDSKTVLTNCRFRGDDGFKLGRYHRDAQFYIINASFPENMADAPIYLNPSNPQNLIRWGQRIYFYNAHRKGGDYAWHADNLSAAEGSPKPENITISWTFAGKWQPATVPVKIDKKWLTGSAPKKVPVISNSSVDTIAENMLLYQRAVGGWPKAIHEVKVNYSKPLSEAEKKALREDSAHKDATIDNSATSREIRYLVKAYRQTNNPAYLAAAEKGILYCLKAQYTNGGWPQYYPDASIYRSQITYNDDAMVNVLNILQDIVEGKNHFELVHPSLIPLCKEAVRKGVDCILNTQIQVNGQLTAWCAQYNPITLQPEMARKFELVSISGSESVGITRFLMRLPEPSAAVQKAIHAAIAWFEKVKIAGYKYGDVTAPEQPSGRDRIIQPDATSTIWARFYEVDTNRPFFSGRNSEKKYELKEIENERRTGYAWYGVWPQKLVQADYPAWLQRLKKL